MVGIKVCKEKAEVIKEGIKVFLDAGMAIPEGVVKELRDLAKYDERVHIVMDPEYKLGSGVATERKG